MYIDLHLYIINVCSIDSHQILTLCYSVRSLCPKVCQNDSPAGSEEKACRLSSNSCTLMVSTCTKKLWHDPIWMYDMMPYPAIPLQFDGKYWWMPTHFYIEMVGWLVYWCLLLGLPHSEPYGPHASAIPKKSAPALYLYLEAWGCYDVRIPKPSATFFCKSFHLYIQLATLW